MTFPDDWQGKFEITSDNTKVSAGVKGLAYDLSLAPAHFWANVKSDGSDIRITSDEAGTTLVARDVVSIDTTAKKGLIRFDTSNISTSVNTSYYLWAGNVSATEPGNTGTYNNNVIAYYSLDEKSGTNASNRVGTDGTANNARVFTSEITGQINTCADFTQSTTDNIDTTFDSSTLDILNPYTISMWINVQNISFFETYLLGNNRASPSFLYYLGITGAGNIRFFHLDTLGTSVVSDSVSLVEDTWYRITAVRDATHLRLYKNGVLIGSSATVATTNLLYTLKLGALGIDASAVTDGADCYMDEVVMQTEAMTADEDLTFYNNESNNATFWTTGSWEDESSINGNQFVKQGYRLYCAKFYGANFCKYTGSISDIQGLTFLIKDEVNNSGLITLTNTASISINVGGDITTTGLTNETITESAVGGWRFINVNFDALTVNLLEVGRVASSYYTGLMDEFGLFSKKLDANDRLQIVQKRLDRDTPLYDTHCQLYWAFDHPVAGDYEEEL